MAWEVAAEQQRVRVRAYLKDLALALFEVTEAVRKLISEGSPLSTISKAAKLKTMADRCRRKMKKGEVSAEEFLRVIRT